MARPDARTERDIAAYTRDVEDALGASLVALVVYGSAAGDGWVAGRSDVNTAVIVPCVTLDVLERLAPAVARYRPRRFALPLVADRDYLDRARDTFPMELDDIRRQHRLLAGTDVFATIETDLAAVRRECEHEARAKVARLRALFLDAAGTPDALEPLMTQSLKSFLILLRHLVRIRGSEAAPGYAAALDAGEALLGPLPVMRRLLAHRTGAVPLRADALRAEFGAYLAEVDRIVAALDADA